jgi:hypothetical protein
MKILFVDHAFHEKTRSSDFFVDMLRERSEVERLYIDPTDREATSRLDAAESFDLAILWQMDFLAPLLIARGIPTVVVPMYDGSSLMPDLHWIWMRNARLVNFSRRLHERVRFLGGTSRTARYFLPPVAEDDRATFHDGLRILLWMRRPEEGINLHTVEKLFSDQIESVHVHASPDNRDVDPQPYLVPTRNDYRLTTSTWFEDRSQFEELLDRHNVLVAPRMAEGIGMVMLEGLARGMIVVANDAPTHDEYISNWLNGVLMNPATVGPARFDRASQLGELAWRSAVDGRARWEAGKGDLVDFILDTPAPPRTEGVDFSRLGRRLVSAYMSGLDSYRAFLFQNVDLIGQMVGESLGPVLDKGGNFVGPSRPAGDDMRGRALRWLDQNRLDGKQIASGEFVVDGEARLAEDRAWVLGQSLSLGFRLDPDLGVARNLRMAFRIPETDGADPVPYSLMLNGHVIAIGAISRGEETLSLDVPSLALGRDNILTLAVQNVSFAFGWKDPVSIGLQKLEFV